MRVTLTLDDDILSAARDLAAREKCSLGAAVSKLARAGLQERVPRLRNGIPVLPRRPNAVPVTLELVNALRDED